MCHGLRDIANLAWKMSLVARGVAPESLLATYQPERDPHVRAVISAAVAAGRYICVLDREQAAQRDTTMRAQASSGAPETAGDLIPAIGTGVVAIGTPGAGERFIQPRVRDRLLDDATGSGWRLFVSDTADAERARALCGERVRGLEVEVIDVSTLDDGGAVRDWLEARCVRAAVIRPDFYVFGTADDDPASLISVLATTLSCGASVTRERAA